MSRLPLPLAGVLAMALALVFALPRTDGLRCRFWVTGRAGPVDYLTEVGRPGLFRQEFGNVDFTAPGGVGANGPLELDWDGPTGFLNRSFRWTGWLQVPRTGQWSIGTDSDDGSLVAIDDWPVVTNWGDHQPLRRFGRVWLSRGLHRLRVDHYQRTGGARIHLLWCPPVGGPDGVLPGAAGPAGDRAVGQPRVVPARYLFRTRGDDVVPPPARPDAGAGRSGPDAAGDGRALFGCTIEARAEADPDPQGDLGHQPWQASNLLVTGRMEPWELRPPPDDRRQGWCWADYWQGWDPDSVVAAGLGRATVAAIGDPVQTRVPATARVWRAHVTVPWTSSYRFRVTTDTPSVLMIDGRPVLGAPGRPTRGRCEAVRTLAMGAHTIRLATAPAASAAAPGLAVTPVSSPGMPVATPTIECGWALTGLSFPDEVPIDEPPILEEVHPGIDFKAGIDLALPYVHRWSVARHGYPHALAPLRARWDGTLATVRSGLHTFLVRGSGRTLLSVGPHRLYKGLDASEASFTVRLATGDVPICLDTHEVGIHRRVGLYWRPPGGSLEPVPAARL
ncbi:MAG: hypothetical protein HY815_26040, partial [Candidatus Riflebacteria bacterium]|nr:hypothetical protein [Candidatus Riflebacteria bacterium]